MSIEQRFDVSLIAAMALREKQIQQSYRPVIAVHKWFARRPGTLFRGLILAEFAKGRLEDAFFRRNDLSGIRIADPFMGGGTPLIEANRVGCDVEGFDINPMATWIVREEIEQVNIEVYRQTAQDLVAELRTEVGGYYRTSCPLYGDPDVPVKSFLWVKMLHCEACRGPFDLFPGYLVAKNRRHPKNVLVCPDCGDLNEVDDCDSPGGCAACSAKLRQTGPASRGRCACPRCGHVNVYPGEASRPLPDRLFAIEYYNPKRKARHRGRFFKKPDAEDVEWTEAAAERCGRLALQFVPDEEVPQGDETNRLRRWGYTHYRDMFNPRQLLGLELSCRLIAEVENQRVRRALATNLSDLLRYQNMLCRYEPGALKAVDIFSIHGFPVGPVRCESNLLGVVDDTGVNVGSGGWSNIIDKYVKAKRYCEAPFEVRREGSRNVRVPIEGESIGERSNGHSRKVSIRCASATMDTFASNQIDAVFTDPPYFGNVQYGELMEFCYVWLRRLVGREAEGFHRTSTRAPEELTGNVTQRRGLEHFTKGLSAVYSRMAVALKPGAPLVFTYHHNNLEAYCAAGVAILDAGLVCTASIPCPAEMRGSIHIHRTGSSIVDTVFVCRASGAIRTRWLFETAEELVAMVSEERGTLASIGGPTTLGDTRCMVFGHLTRMAVWRLRDRWNCTRSVVEKLHTFADALHVYGDPDELVRKASATKHTVWPRGTLFATPESREEAPDVVSF